MDLLSRLNFRPLSTLFTKTTQGGSTLNTFYPFYKLGHFYLLLTLFLNFGESHLDWIIWRDIVHATGAP